MLTPERMQRAYELFEQALERLPEERSGFLGEVYRGDAELRAELNSLQEHDSRVPEDFMQPPDSDNRSPRPPAEECFDPLIASRVGLGRLLTKLGRYPEAERLLLNAQGTLFSTPAVPQRSVGRMLKGLVELYDAWHAAEPGKGHDSRAAEWGAKFEQWQAATQAARSGQNTQL